MLPIDYCAWTNRWHARHAGEKLLLAGGLLMLGLVLPPVTTAPLILAVVGCAAVYGAGIPLAVLLRTLAVPGLFLLTSVPFLVVSVDLDNGIAFSPQGLETACEVTLRALAAVACLALLSLTTPLIDWLPGLRRLGVPPVIMDLILLIYRLIFVLAERAAAGTKAQAARLGHAGFRTRLRALGWLVAGLWRRSLQQVRQLEIGLAARGFSGELKVLPIPRELSQRRLLLTGGLLAAVAAAGLALDQALTR